MSQTTSTPPAAVERDLAEEFLDRQTPLDRVRVLLHKYPAISPAIVLVIAVIVFGLINPRFLLPGNLSLITQQVAVVGTLAVAQTLIILTAGIDLSVGAAMILTSMVVAQTTVHWGLPALVGLLIGLIAGLATGALNGFLVTRLKLPPFIVTLGTLNIFVAVTLLATGGATVRGMEMPDALTATGTAFEVGGVRITVGVLIMLALYLVVALILGKTAWGRHVYAVGDDIEAARLVGIRVDRVLLSVYTVAGLIYGLTAWVLIGRAGTASPNAIPAANLETITAVVIGGTSLFGGRGGILGTMLGALIVYAFNIGLSLAGVDDQLRVLTIGVLIIVAVAVDQWIRKVKA